MSNRILVIVALFLFAMSICFAQTEALRFRIKGQIIDEQTKKVLANFPIKIKEFDRKVYSNDKGEFLFNMTGGTYTFVLDDYPYTTKQLSIQLISDTVLFISMNTPAGVHRLQEVQVLANKQFTEKSASITKIGAAEMKALPAMIGERDILKAISLTAGVSSSGEGSADMQVRGGLHGQNLFLLDNIALYSTQHMFGMVSAFNPIIIKSAELYKSGFPAEYGGRIASVLDVRTKEPDLSNSIGELEISMLTSKAAVNFPIAKNKLGFTLATRISNYSLLNLVSIANLIPDSKIGLHFADLNAGILYKPTTKDDLKLSIFYNSDGLNVKSKEFNASSTVWQNNRQKNISLNWTHLLTKNSTNTVQLFADSYKFELGNDYNSIYSDFDEYYNVNTSINSFGINEKLNKIVTDKFSLSTGISLKAYQFSPYNVSFTDSTYFIHNPSIIQYESDVFVQTKYEIIEGHTVDVGMRGSSFGNTDKTYFSFEPRCSYFWKINDDFSISASLSRMTQNIHRVANPGLGFPIELFQSSDAYLKPEKSWIYSVGAAKDYKIRKEQLSVKADIWYKNMWNIVAFKDGYDAITLLFSDNFTSKYNSSYLTMGNAKAYGIDVSATYTSSKFKLSADYTLMEARNQFDALNSGNWFAASTDIRHALTLIGEIKLRKEWTLNATWQLQSGRPITLPTAVFPISDIDLSSASVNFQYGKEDVNNQSFQSIETERNNARMRPFHSIPPSNRIFCSSINDSTFAIKS